jgi:type II secretory pathway component GspD/PulD (secretin)
MNAVPMFAGFALALMLFVSCAGAQTQPADCKAAEAKPTPPEAYQTFFLTNLTQPNELNDVSTDLRNTLSPRTKVYAVSSQNAISVRGTADDIQQAQKMISELDRPKKTYRLTYTIIETDGGKRAGTQSFALTLASGEMVGFKQGNRVPIVTASFDAETSAPHTNVQYQDVGLRIEATVDTYADGLRLRTKVEQTSLAEEKSGVGPQDPVIRQAMLEGISTLALGKPLVLGSFDLPGGTRKQEVEVVAELVR